MKRLIIITMTIFLLGGCSLSRNWTGFYYPDADNIGDSSKWVIQPGFGSLDECRNWAEDISTGNTNFDYECGYKCKYNKEYGTNVCKKTEQ